MIRQTAFVIVVLEFFLYYLSFAQPASLPTPEVVKTGLIFPEGPAFDGKNTLYVSNCYGGYISRFSQQGTMDTASKAEKPGALIQKTNGLTVGHDGCLYVCDFGKKAIIKISPDGKQQIYAEAYQGQPFLGPNDLAFDPEGNLWFTDPTGSNITNNAGAIYRVQAGGKGVTKVAGGLAFPNGIAFSADARTLYVAESMRHRIVRYTVLPGGTLSTSSVFAEMPTQHEPDGIAFDAEGKLYVAHYGGGAVRIFAPDGKYLHSIMMPGKNITNVEFAGEDLRTLYITEADTGTLYKLRTAAPGLRLLWSPK